jgi:hypothetical protein
MKKLEDLPKKEIFNVPEGYFDKLPGVIQSRIAAEKKPEAVGSFPMALRFTIPMVVIGLAVFWFSRASQTDSVETMLTNIQTADLVAYLEDTDLSTEELLESVRLDQGDAEEIENQVYDFNLDDAELDTMIEDLDLNEL